MIRWFSNCGAQEVVPTRTSIPVNMPLIYYVFISNVKCLQVGYIHDGSENFNDSLILQIEFSTSVGFVLPAYLQGKNYFLLHIDVAPMNDPPFLFIPSAKVLRLAEVNERIKTITRIDFAHADASE